MRHIISPLEQFICSLQHYYVFLRAVPIPQASALHKPIHDDFRNQNGLLDSFF